MTDRAKLIAAHEAANQAQDIVTNLETALGRSSVSIATAQEALNAAVATPCGG